MVRRSSEKPGCFDASAASASSRTGCGSSIGYGLGWSKEANSVSSTSLPPSVITIRSVRSVLCLTWSRMPSRSSIQTESGEIDSPRNDRLKCPLCSTTTTSREYRASSSASARPAGPPPTTHTWVFSAVVIAFPLLGSHSVGATESVPQSRDQRSGGR